MYKFLKNKEMFSDAGKTAETASQDIVDGLEVLNNLETPLVSVFGSHLTGPHDELYQQVKKLGHELGKAGFGVITGGGPGLMEAANAGAMDAGVASIGIKEAMLSREQVSADVHTHTINCEYMFVRRFLLAIKSQALIFMPGGFGTLNELFEFLVLIQIDLSDPVPVVLVGSDYWTGLESWIHEQLLERFELIDESDMQLFTIVDTPSQVINAINR